MGYSIGGYNVVEEWIAAHVGDDDVDGRIDALNHALFAIVEDPWVGAAPVPGQANRLMLRRVIVDARAIVTYLVAEQFLMVRLIAMDDY